MNYEVSLVAEAETDLYEVHRYVESHDSAPRADALLDGIEQTVVGLSKMPQRGHHPPELERIGITEYRELHYKQFRIIYVIHDKEVIVHCLLDGRRDMQTLLQQRLLR